MRKFKCECVYNKCFLETEKEEPNHCVLFHHDPANWQEVKEDNAKKVDELVDNVKQWANNKEEIKDIISDIPEWVIDGIFNEYRWAVDKHPKFPDNEFEMMCIIQEELGEAIQALNNFKHHNDGCINDVYIELLHTIVSCMRALKTLDGNYPQC